MEVSPKHAFTACPLLPPAPLSAPRDPVEVALPSSSKLGTTGFLNAFLISSLHLCLDLLDVRSPAAIAPTYCVSVCVCVCS